jgi:hypothetical protein
MVTFEHKDHQHTHGSFTISHVTRIKAGEVYNRVAWILLKCAGCGRGGIVSVAYASSVSDGKMLSFHPDGIVRAQLPSSTPEGIQNEFREAELCAEAGAYRSGCGMLRSTLEKTLKLNGFTAGSLYSKIEAAAQDAVITDARRKRAQDEVRVLGNDVLHDEWRKVDADEFSLAHHYVQRIIEDFYDDRASVLVTLKSKGRL